MPVPHAEVMSRRRHPRRLRAPWRSAWLSIGRLLVSLNVAQVESFERRFGYMARRRPKRGDHLTPEQAHEGHLWIRFTVLAAVLQAWMAVTVVALFVPHLLGLFLALGVAYSLAAPLLLGYLNRDVDRRVLVDGAPDSLVSLARAAGLPSPSSLSAPPR